MLSSNCDLPFLRYSQSHGQNLGQKFWIWGSPGVPPPKGEKICLGPMYITMMQNFTPISAIVAEIYVTGHRKNTATNIPFPTNVWRVKTTGSVRSQTDYYFRFRFNRMIFYAHLRLSRICQSKIAAARSYYVGAYRFRPGHCAKGNIQLITYVHSSWCNNIYLVNAITYVGDRVATDAVKRTGGDVTGSRRDVPA